MCLRSGPKRYDWTGDCWKYSRDGVTLHQLLSTEFSAIFKLNMDLSALLHSWQLSVSGVTFCPSPSSPKNTYTLGIKTCNCIGSCRGNTPDIWGPKMWLGWNIIYGLLWLVPTVVLMARLRWLGEMKCLRIWGEYYTMWRIRMENALLISVSLPWRNIY